MVRVSSGLRSGATGSPMEEVIMADARESAEFVSSATDCGTDEWLGAEGFLGQSAESHRQHGPGRPWAAREVLVLGFSMLTLGVALGVLLSGSRR